MNNKLSLYVIFIIGIVFSIFSYSYILEIEENKTKDKLIQQSKDILNIYESTLEKNINTILLMSSIFSNYEIPTRSEFKNITKTAITSDSITTGISWNPYIKDEQRNKYLEMAKADGLSDFKFTGLNSDGKKVVSPKKSSYVPVYYIEPFLKNKGALGFDISSNETRNNAINQARDTGNVVFTQRINLVQKNKNSYGTLAMKAVYEKNKPINTKEERRDNFKGIIVGVFSFDELSKQVLKQLNINNIHIKLKDLSADTKSQLLFESSNNENSNINIMWQNKISKSNDKWQLETYITKEYMQSRRSYYPQLFMIIGILITFIIVLYLFSKLKKTDELEKELKENLEVMSKYIVYSRTDKNGKITDVSNAFCRLSGYSRDELMGSSHNIIRHPDTPNSVFEEMWKNLNAGKAWKGEIKNKKKDGSAYWIFNDIQPKFDNHGELIGFISVRSDITDRKKYELQQIQLLEQSKMAAMGQMIGNIAHQWRQPLSVISTLASGINLKRDLEILKEEEVTNSMNVIVKNAKYLSKTIETFKNFLKEKKEKKEICIQEKLNETLNILSATIQNNHLRIINNTTKLNPVVTYIVSGEIEQVIINIINNAKDIFVEKNIDDRWIKFELKTTKDKILLTIEDNGGGIPEEIIHNIFEPYFTTKHQSQGTGLGLYMSHKIVVESLNGDIYVKNTQNGAKFYIKLPII